MFARLLLRVRGYTNRRGYVRFRWFNEIPALLPLAAVVLVVVKPPF